MAFNNDTNSHTSAGSDDSNTNEMASHSPPAHDPLVQAIAIVARHYGFAAHAAALTAGLPLASGRLALEDGVRAAERAGLRAQTERRKLSSLRSEDCPCLVMLKPDGVAVVSAIDTRRMATVVRVTSENAALQQVKLRALQAEASGEVMTLTPMAETLNEPEHLNRLSIGQWLRAAFFDTRGAVFQVLVATIMVNLIGLITPLFTMNIYDRVIPNAALNSLWALSIGALLAIGFDFFMRMLRAEIIDLTGRRVDVRLANGLFARLLGAKVSHSPTLAGSRAAIVRDYESVREFFQSITLTTLGDIPFSLIYIIAVYALGGPLVISLLVLAPLTLLCGIIIQWRLKGLLDRQHTDMLLKTAVATEVIIGMETIKALGAESWAAEKWERAVADGIRQGVRIRRLTNMANHLVIAAQLLVSIIMVFHGTYLVLEGVLTTGALIAAVMLSGRALSPVGQAALLITRTGQTKVALRGLAGIIESEQERSPTRQTIAHENFSGALSCEAMSFGYDKDAPPVLKDVSFTIRPGERVAVLGAIGSGKSTLLKLIINLLTPQSGRLYVDGLAVTHLEPALLRRSVALVAQDTVLFRGTIRENVRIHCPELSDDAVLKALELAGAREWVSRLPKGLDTPIGERGQGLSGGQRQSLALARCFAAEPKMLLLDEPTSGLDDKAEARLLASIDSYCRMQQATLLIVTHRPAVLGIVGRIMVFDSGLLRMDGPKDEVLAALTPIPATAPPVPATPSPQPIAIGASLKELTGALKSSGGAK